MRRRQRRLRAWLRHERMTVAMALGDAPLRPTGREASQGQGRVGRRGELRRGPDDSFPRGGRHRVLQVKDGGAGGQVIAQVIPEVQVPPRVIPRRVQQRTNRLADAPVPQITSQERISGRITEQIVDAPGMRGIPQERISERIVEQIVLVPQVIPQTRTSERIHKQTVDIPLQVIPQERISERIAEQTVDEIPGPAGRGTLRAAAAASAAAECLRRRGISHFSPEEKSARSSRESSANLVSHSSSWPPAAYEEEEELYEYFDDEGMAWRRRWSQTKYMYWFRDLDIVRWMGPISKAPWDL